MRRNPGDVPDEPVAVFAENHRAEAERVATELGPGHDVQPVRMLAPGSGHRVLTTWACDVVVRPGQPNVGEPYRLDGAAQVWVPGEPEPVQVGVRVDHEASTLEQQVTGRRVRYATAYAEGPAQVRGLARAWAQGVAESL
ncbi:hypothetical protein [Goodfellowiella coeruleoviolacea]|nr:hypothetical protein [Goodfellowiella coeruleoviolacea]